MLRITGSPPYHSFEDKWDDWPRQAKRSVRKAIGLPASSDVAIIANVLKAVADVAERCLDSPISALVSFPALPGLYQEDISDAATYIGLRQIGTDTQATNPHEILAAYAGNGLGLCKSYEVCEKCREEGKHLPERHTLLVEYTETALLIHCSSIREAIELSWPHVKLKASFGLGSAQSPDERDLRDFVLQLLHQQYFKPAPDGLPDSITVMVTGSPESIGDGKMRRATNVAIEALGTKADILDSNPGFVAARGAADLAWRALSAENRMEL